MQPPTTTATSTKSRGAVLLGKADATQDEIAQKCGISRQAVAKWLSGASSPGAPLRKKLARSFKVPVAAWDEATAATVARRPIATAPPAPQPEDLDAELDEIEASGLATDDAESAAALAESLGTWCKRALSFLATNEVDGKAATIADKLGRTIERVGKLRGELDVGKNLLKLPQWKTAERTIEVALRGHPDAARAVEAALRKLEDEL